MTDAQKAITDTLMLEGAEKIDELRREKAALQAEVELLRAQKWGVQHTDTMNEMVQMGLALEAAKAEHAAVRGALELCAEEIEENLQFEGRLASFKAALGKANAALATDAGKRGMAVVEALIGAEKAGDAQQVLAAYRAARRKALEASDA